MDEFRVGHHNPKPFPLQMNSNNMELFSNMGSLEGFMPLSNDGFSPLPPMSFNDQIPRSIGPVFDPMTYFFPSGHAMSMAPEPEIMVNSSPSVSGTGFLAPAKVDKNHQEQNYSGKKRKRIGEKEMERPREVVHVRAKRGQATDSHSLAERTMGMAVMLDVIINYVRSLQNQIDFLSMKLSAASLFYDFNSAEAEAMETLQGTNVYEGGPMMEKLVGEGYGGISQLQTPFPNL